MASELHVTLELLVNLALRVLVFGGVLWAIHASMRGKRLVAGPSKPSVRPVLAENQQHNAGRSAGV
jgi:hypothetical protein